MDWIVEDPMTEEAKARWMWFKILQLNLSLDLISCRTAEAKKSPYNCTQLQKGRL